MIRGEKNKIKVKQKIFQLLFTKKSNAASNMKYLKMKTVASNMERKKY